jgi:hypothetical protein
LPTSPDGAPVLVDTLIPTADGGYRAVRGSAPSPPVDLDGGQARPITAGRLKHEGDRVIALVELGVMTTEEARAQLSLPESDEPILDIERTTTPSEALLGFIGGALSLIALELAANLVTGWLA